MKPNTDAQGYEWSPNYTVTFEGSEQRLSFFIDRAGVLRVRLLDIVEHLQISLDVANEILNAEHEAGGIEGAITRPGAKQEPFIRLDTVMKFVSEDQRLHLVELDSGLRQHIARNGGSSLN